MSTKLDDNDTPRRVRITLDRDINQFIDSDATTSENHTRSARMTESPVEEGADTTDHYQVNPDELTIMAVFTDTPVIVNAPDFVDVKDRAAAADRFLDLIMDRGYAVTVTTRLKIYPNMRILLKSVGRDRSTGRVVRAQLTFKRFTVARTERTEAPEPVAPQRNTKKKLGKQNKKPEESEKLKGQSTSTASRLAGKSVTDFFSSGF